MRLLQLPGARDANPTSATPRGKGLIYFSAQMWQAPNQTKPNPKCPLFWFSFSDLITLKPAFFILILKLSSFEILKFVFFWNIKKIKSTGCLGAKSLWKIVSFCTAAKNMGVLTTRERPAPPPACWIEPGMGVKLPCQSPLIVWH